MPYDFPILLFDGVCNFCHSSVQFVIKRDPKHRFHFAALQSETGQQLLKTFGFDTKDFDTVVLIENNRCYTKSTAALRVTKHLKGAWKLLLVFIVVPRPIRDWIYRLIAKNRYRFFGKKVSCSVPDPAVKHLFLD